MIQFPFKLEEYEASTSNFTVNLPRKRNGSSSVHDLICLPPRVYECRCRVFLVQDLLECGVVQLEGPNRKPYYCLFFRKDFLSRNKLSFSQKLSVEIPVGTFLLANARLVEEGSSIPFLATTLWEDGAILGEEQVSKLYNTLDSKEMDRYKMLSQDLEWHLPRVSDVNKFNTFQDIVDRHVEGGDKMEISPEYSGSSNKTPRFYHGRIRSPGYHQKRSRSPSFHHNRSRSPSFHHIRARSRSPRSNHNISRSPSFRHYRARSRSPKYHHNTINTYKSRSSGLHHGRSPGYHQNRSRSPSLQYVRARSRSPRYHPDTSRSRSPCLYNDRPSSRSPSLDRPPRKSINERLGVITGVEKGDADKRPCLSHYLTACHTLKEHIVSVSPAKSQGCKSRKGGRSHSRSRETDKERLKELQTTLKPMPVHLQCWTKNVNSETERSKKKKGRKNMNNNIKCEEHLFQEAGFIDNSAILKTIDNDSENKKGILSKSHAQEAIKVKCEDEKSAFWNTEIKKEPITDEIENNDTIENGKGQVIRIMKGHYGIAIVFGNSGCLHKVLFDVCDLFIGSQTCDELGKTLDDVMEVGDFVNLHAIRIQDPSKDVDILYLATSVVHSNSSDILLNTKVESFLNKKSLSWRLKMVSQEKIDNFKLVTKIAMQDPGSFEEFNLVKQIQKDQEKITNCSLVKSRIILEPIQDLQSGPEVKEIPKVGKVYLQKKEEGFMRIVIKEIKGEVVSALSAGERVELKLPVKLFELPDNSDATLPEKADAMSIKAKATSIKDRLGVLRRVGADANIHKASRKGKKQRKKQKAQRKSIKDSFGAIPEIGKGELPEKAGGTSIKERLGAIPGVGKGELPEKNGATSIKDRLGVIPGVGAELKMQLLTRGLLDGTEVYKASWSSREEQRMRRKSTKESLGASPVIEKSDAAKDGHGSLKPMPKHLQNWTKHVLNRDSRSISLSPDPNDGENSKIGKSEKAPTTF